MPTDSGYGSASLHDKSVPLTLLSPRLSARRSNFPGGFPAEADSTASGTCISVTDEGTQSEGTIYTDIMSLSDTRTEQYASALAQDLFSALELATASPDIVEPVLSTLPELLRTMSLKIGYEAPSQEHRDVMVFIHKFRR